MSNPYVGEIRMFGGNFAPSGWSFCNGQLLDISTNQVLFALIGTTYGGDGVNTFAVPDLRGRLPIHQGQGPGLSNYVIGQLSGTENVTLLSTQLPQHNHALQVSNNLVSDSVPGSTMLPGQLTSGELYDTPPAAPNLTMNPSSLGLIGGNQPHSNIQPYLSVSFIISMFGVFPSRN